MTEARALSDPRQAAAVTGSVLALRDVSVTLGRRRLVDGVTLELFAGQFWGLIGPNGAGKSTLLAALVGARTPSCGSILIRGQDLADLGAKQRARQITLLGQELGSDLPLSVEQLVQLGRLPYLKPFATLSATDHSRVEAALTQAGVSHLKHRLLGSLSDGERQRVHLARALAQSPSILLLDEATAHLDLVHREEALARLRRFAQIGRVAVAALHDIDLALRHTSHLAVMHQGCVVSQGPKEQVLTPRILAQVFGVEARVQRDDRGISLRVFGPSSAPAHH